MTRDQTTGISFSIVSPYKNESLRLRSGAAQRGDTEACTLHRYSAPYDVMHLCPTTVSNLQTLLKLLTWGRSTKKTLTAAQRGAESSNTTILNKKIMSILFQTNGFN